MMRALDCNLRTIAIILRHCYFYMYSFILYRRFFRNRIAVIPSTFRMCMSVCIIFPIELVLLFAIFSIRSLDFLLFYAWYIQYRDMFSPITIFFNFEPNWFYYFNWNTYWTIEALRESWLISVVVHFNLNIYLCFSLPPFMHLLYKFISRDSIGQKIE